MFTSHHRGRTGRLLGLMFVGLIVSAGSVSACSKNVSAEMSAAPPPAAVDKATSYADDHAGDKVTYPRGKSIPPPKDWVRGVVLRVGHQSTQTRGNQWLGVVVLETKHGNKQPKIASDYGEENAAKALRTNVHRGDYIAYVPDQGGMLRWNQTIIVIKSHAVPEVANAPE